MPPVNGRIGERLQALREGDGMSAAELGRALGPTRQQIGRYELASYRIRASTLRRIAELLNVEVGAFFQPPAATGSGEEPKLGAGVIENTSSVSAVADVEDLEVRRHLAELLEALGDRP